MKGFHNTIDGWRDDRDEGGWKHERSAWKDVLDHYLDKEDLLEEEYDKIIASGHAKGKSPEKVMPAPRLFDDIEVLIALMKSKYPVKVPARHERTIEVIYGFGDASGRDLGSNTQTGKYDK